MKIKATPLYNRAAEIVPSPGDRAWVRESGLEGAGLALESVNDKGWDLVCPCAFEATWNGGPSAEDIEIADSLRNARMIYLLGGFTPQWSTLV